MGVFSSLFSGSKERAARAFLPIVEEINALEAEYKAKSDEDIRAEIAEMRAHPDLSREYLDEILPRVFAMVREASRRTSGKRHFDVQLLGGIALHRGTIAEMRTGEGKTLVATLPTALNALLGKGVHVVTVNDYLARRDAVWMGEIYHFLGLSVGCINHDTSFIYDPAYAQGSAEDKKRDDLGSFKVVDDFLRPTTRREAYEADITYGTNNEYGFDWLRDNLAPSFDGMRQREHYFAVVDEVDSILIDEARTPLIISAPDEEAESLYRVFSGIAPKLTRDVDYTVDEKHRAVLVNDEGISKVEKILGISDMYSEKGVRYVRHLEQSLRAQALFIKDRHYVVKNNEIIIVDEFTGRMMPGRRWSEGLHQAVEAKENVEIQKESRTLATITFQNYFRMYEKLSGMTGTAETSREEFLKVYNLDVTVIPTHQPMVRRDHPDRIYQTEHGKFLAVAREIKKRHETGQPVLLGTASIEKNEILSAILTREGVPHHALNAKNHEREAEIIAQAGKLGAVTLATNIAGRGVDIILGGTPPVLADAEKVRALGGLFVLGTERHEARRIDNQLRGRAGRQGDPGESCFFLSFEDDLLRIFAPERLKGLMGKLGIPEDEPVEAGMVTRAIEQAQTKIEGLHFDSRKHLLEYDDVLSKQRTAVYRQRREMLRASLDGVDTKVRELIAEFARRVHEANETPEEAKKVFMALLHKGDEEFIVPESLDLPEGFISALEAEYQLRMSANRELFLQNARALFLQIIDMFWRDHLEVMEYTRSSVGLRAYGQRDPLVEYKNEAHKLFKTFNANLAAIFIENIFKVNSDAHIHQHETRMVTNEQRAVANRIVKDARTKDLGRNDPCYCGSGKKFKKCHGQ
ncbi:MAG: preprotein translocase subunit SecA [Patescibacteria group bacterium]